MDDSVSDEGGCLYPEFAMHDIRQGQPVRLLVRGQLTPLSGVLVHRARIVDCRGPNSEGAVAGNQSATLLPRDGDFSNPGDLSPGMTGLAKVVVARRSLAGLAFLFGRDLLWRKIW